ncbi:MAG: nitroreductase family deazaflavin-dependent oxidoreductase [Acidimicrobiia bacterium]|nr:nitroreductase family deazaflavin-dependent oxidoreductase [Acidimicrobiia bacterium]
MSRASTRGHGKPTSRTARGSNPIVVWAIKYIISPIDRFVVRVGRGRIRPPTSGIVPTVLMTTVGRKSGRDRTTPLVFVRDGDDYLVANARPAGERRNPWVFNLRAAGTARLQQRGRVVEVTAHELDDDELEQWWPEMVDVWPAFADHYAATGERTMFRLSPTTTTTDGDGP